MDYFKSMNMTDWSESDSGKNEGSDGDHDGSDDENEDKDENEEGANNKDGDNNGILQVHLVVDKDTKRSHGIAYIHFTLPESAARAMEELDQTIFQGRLLHVMPAKQKEQNEKREHVLLFISSFKINLWPSA